jgi:hypothetical protein
LDKTVKYTNEYGLVHAKRWKDISRKDLESFFAILFILGNKKGRTTLKLVLGESAIGESFDEEGNEW